MAGQQFANPQALIQQVVQATESLSDQEAAQRYQQILAQLPPEQASELNALALSQVGADERRSLAGQFRAAHNDPNRPFSGYDVDDDDEAATPQVLGRLSARAQQQDPALLGSVLGSDNPLGGQIGKAALAALATLLIRQVLSGQQGAQQSGGYAGSPAAGGADPLSTILGGLLGGAAGGGSASGGSGLDLGTILGSILAGSGAPSQAPQSGMGGAASGLDLGSILGSVLGSGGMANKAPQGGGLGSLLEALLEGASNQTSHRK